MASANFRKALQKLAGIWHDPTAKSAIVLAGTGSGKEELKEILAYGLCLEPDHLVQFSAPEVTAAQQPLEKVYDKLEAQHLISPMRVGRRKTKGRSQPSVTKEKQSLRPDRVVLFFDEIHQAGVDGLRTLLLRVMETKELTKNRKTLDCTKALYLFAASKQPAELRTSSPPPDFWTRVQYTVEMRHPLALKTADERNEVLRQYFCFFWQKAAHDRGIKDKDSLRSDDTLLRLAPAFANTLDSPLIPLISVRVLQSIVSRLLSMAIYNSRTTGLREEGLLKLTEKKMDDWIFEIFAEIGPEISPQGLF